MKRLSISAAHGLILVILLVAGGCATDKSVLKEAAKYHQKLELAVLPDPQLSAYMQKVGERVVTAAQAIHAERGAKNGDAGPAWLFEKPIQFHLLASRTLNAFTTGGRHVYVYGGLFIQVDTEEELAAVMAHEFAHIYGRHVQQTLNRQYGLKTLASAAGLAGSYFGVGGWGGTATELAGGMVGLRYDRHDEDEADKLGLEFYTRAGWDPARFDDFFERMQKLGGDKGPEILSDHPALKNRVSAAVERATRLEKTSASLRRPNVATAAEFKELQQRCNRLLPVEVPEKAKQ